MHRCFLKVAVLALLGASIAGCGEREQVVSYKDGKYQGKPDGRPWDSQPRSDGSAGWVKGDHASWENEVKARTGGQGENRRIGD